MPLNRGRRSAYNPISSSDAEEENDDDQQQQQTNSPGGDEPPSNRQRNNNGRRRNYTRVANNVVESRESPTVSKEDTPLTAEDSVDNSNSTTLKSKTLGLDGSGEEEEEDFEDSGERITIVVLDAAQKRFPVAINPDWSVQKFKQVGARIHKVAPLSQRLIFRGKLLEDKKTLKEYGIVQSDVIVHLFPKPKVIVTSASAVTDASSIGTNQDDDGAHVPHIILDEEEQERRGQILVLGSVEIAEAQNNVKLLSLLLLVVCSMRLLALFSIAMGVAEEPVYEDDMTPPSDRNRTDDHDYPGQPEYEVRSWENQDYYDLAVSSIGFYVATLGMKATTENTSGLATAYLIGTIIAGISWNIWNMFMFVLFYQEETTEKDDDEMIPLDRDDFVTIALFTVMLPMLVWFLCCTRAYQFRHLIEEAEQEAVERIRSQLTVTEGNDENARELTEISRSHGRPTIV